MKKLVFTFFVIFLYQVVPLLCQPNLILHWKMLIIIISATVLWQSQPPIRLKEVTVNKNKDKNTLWLILFMVSVSTIVPEIIWAYNFSDHEGILFWNLQGLFLLVLGIFLRLWSIMILGNSFTASVQTSLNQTLVMKGPYAVIRHPSYLGAFIAIIGCSVLLQTLVGFTVSFIAMSFAYYQRIKVEEKMMIEHFGEAYINYASATNRLIPGVW